MAQDLSEAFVIDNPRGAFGLPVLTAPEVDDASSAATVASPLAYTKYTGASDVTTGPVTSATFVDIIAGGTITFTPTTTAVLVRASAFMNLPSSQDAWLGFREGSSDVAASDVEVSYSGGVLRYTADAIVTGLTAGVAKTWKLAWRSTGGSMYLYTGPTKPLVISAWAL